MKRSVIVGVMGGGTVTTRQCDQAETLGGLIAEEGWILLNGGRNSGIMDASAKGAAEKGGITLGILPGNTRDQMSDHISIPVVTGMGNARNVINVLSSDIIVACPGGAGTLSEISLAIKSGKTVILFNYDPGNSFDEYKDTGAIKTADSPLAVIRTIKECLDG